MRCPKFSPNPSSEWRKKSVPHRGNLSLQCIAFAGPTGPAFSFSAYSPLLSAASLRVETHWFPLTLGWPLPTDLPTTGSHGSNRAGNLFRWCCFPTWLPKPHTGPHGAEFGFSPQNEFTPPHKGGGAGYLLSWVRRVCPARSKLTHTGPTGLV